MSSRRKMNLVSFPRFKIYATRVTPIAAQSFLHVLNWPWLYLNCFYINLRLFKSLSNRVQIGRDNLYWYNFSRFTLPQYSSILIGWFLQPAKNTPLSLVEIPKNNNKATVKLFRTFYLDFLRGFFGLLINNLFGKCLGITTQGFQV